MALLADATRLRLLALLEQEELSVAELAQATCLAQPRVSTHLGKLREAGLVSDRRDGVSVYYRLTVGEAAPSLQRLWLSLHTDLDDGLIEADAGRLTEILARRRRGHHWPDSVAGDMARHYSPGRSWEATAHAMAALLTPGRTLDMASGDGVMAELIGPRASRLDCIDISEKVVEAGRQRTAKMTHVTFHQGDMHALPFADAHYDTVLCLHALTYSEAPKQVLAEAARVLAPGGQLICATLHQHKQLEQVTSYGHVNTGFSTRKLRSLAEQAGLSVQHCEVTSVESRPPHFEVITLLAQKP